MDLMKKQFTGDLKAIDTEKRTITAMVSTDSIDRHGDVIVPAGWKLDNYRKNPVVLWAHDYYGLPVAKALAMEITEHGLMAMMQFAEHELARDVFDLYAGGFLRAFSVGFYAVAYEPRSNGARGWLIKEAELLEFSCVPVPANQDALVLAMKTAKLCGLEPRASNFAPSAEKAEHYLDLAEHTRLTDHDDEREEAETQTRVDLAAEIAALTDLNKRIQEGGTHAGSHHR